MPKTKEITKQQEKDEKDSPTYFLSLTLENIHCFGPQQTLDLSDGKGKPAMWTVLLGDNGTGKTTLLRCLAGHGEYYKYKEVLTIGDLIQNYIILNDIKLKYGSKGGFFSAEIVSNFNKQKIKSTLTVKSWNSPIFTGDYLSPYLVWYGASRNSDFFNSDVITHGEYERTFGGQYDGVKIFDGEGWLISKDHLANKPSSIRDQERKQLIQILDSLREVLPDILNIRISTPSVEEPSPRVQFQSPYGWMTLDQLSLGYQTMFGWMTDLVARLYDRYPDSPDPLKEPAVVLIDEIDLHMHPSWQRKIQSYLTERFPNTQFIVTAHSPLIVQAAADSDANIALLRRVENPDGDDYVEIINNPEDIRGWRVDQIMTSDLFGQPARSVDIEKLLEEKKTLILKKKLTKHEEARLKLITKSLDSLPTAETPGDIKDMELIRSVAKKIRAQGNGK